MTNLKTANTIRKYHRYLGFFLAGIMAIYAISGTLLIFRNTDFLKYEQTVERQLEPNLSADKVRSELRIKQFRITSNTADQLTFRTGSYDKNTGLAVFTDKEYPPVLDKMVHLHKATTDSPLYILNILFGAALLFFSVSAFFMFLKTLPTYKTGLKFAAAGFLLALAMVAVS